jgi:hypothetical protein
VKVKIELEFKLDKKKIYIYLVHGNWSPWSEWSLCPKTCGKSFRSRIRTCTNPQPKNNGRLCIGSEREEESCPEIICSSDSLHISSWSGTKYIYLFN